MISILPMAVPDQIDESTLKDLLIDLGRASNRHRAQAALLPNMDIEAFIRSCNEMEAASQTMWRYLLDRICLPEGYPPRLRDVLCLSVMCRLFRYSATVIPHGPNIKDGRASWSALVVIRDKDGQQLSEATGASGAFDPSNTTESLAAYYGAAANGFREAARMLFPFGAPYDAEDNVVVVDAKAREPQR